MFPRLLLLAEPEDKICSKIYLLVHESGMVVVLSSDTPPLVCSCRLSSETCGQVLSVELSVVCCLRKSNAL